MAQNTNQFVVTVADVILRDTTADEVVLKGKTLLNSSIAQEVQNTEIRGGKANKLLYDYNFGKTMNITIEDAVWREQYIALNNGAQILNQAEDYYIFEESVTLSAGSGTLAQTPVGNIYVEKPDKSIATITPTGKDFTVAGLTNETVKVTYRYNTTVDSITIDGSSFPNAYELTMFTELYNPEGKLADVQIQIYRFKPNGAFELNFGSDSVATSSLEGKALATDNDVYAKVLINPVTASTSYIAIAATPSDVTLGSGENQQITTYGIRGGLYGNVTIAASDCTYVEDSGGLVITVSAGGLITYVGAGSAIVTVTHTASGLKDYINVTCT